MVIGLVWFRGFSAQGVDWISRIEVRLMTLHLRVWWLRAARRHCSCTTVHAEIHEKIASAFPSGIREPTAPDMNRALDQRIAHLEVCGFRV